MAFSLPFAVLLFLEVALRLLGVGQDLSLVIRVPGSPQRLAHQFNDSVDLQYYGQSALTGPETRRFDLPKPPNTFRIVFLGASTVIGFPYSPELAFPRQAEVQLQRQEPETQFEVLNAGIVSINSFAVADLARQALDCDPDLIVIHSGHNEFYGPGGPASSALNLPPEWIRFTYRLRRLRIVQLLSAAFASKPVEDDLLNILPRTMEIPAGGKVFEQAGNNLRNNLERAVQVCRNAGVPVVLSTVASNIRNQSPLRAVWPEGTPEDRRAEWEQLMEQGERLLNEKQLEEALRVLSQAEEICGQHARLLWRKAQCLEQLGRSADARAGYLQARDADACRFRAPSSFSKIIREVAEHAGAAQGRSASSGKSDAPVLFLDVESALDRIANPAGAGDDLYLEHVHYNAEGHRQLGLIFARCFQEQVRGRPWDESRAPSTQELDQLLGMLPEDHLAALSFTKQVYGTAPFRTAVDHDAEDKRAGDETMRRYLALPKDRRDAFAELPMNVMAYDVVLPLAEMHLARKDFELALQFTRAALRRRPWSPEAWFVNARVRDRMGDVAGAKTDLQTALELRPGWKLAAEYLSVLKRP